MKIFVIKTENGVSTGTLPFRENAVNAQPIEITEEEFQKINDSKLINKFKDGKFSFEPVPPPQKTPEEIAKTTLLAKIEGGTATTTDLQEAVKILLKH